MLLCKTVDNLNKMVKFLKKYKLPKLIQEEIKNFNRLITVKKNITPNETLPRGKSPGPDGYTG